MRDVNGVLILILVVILIVRDDESMEMVKWSVDGQTVLVWYGMWYGMSRVLTNPVDVFPFPTPGITVDKQRGAVIALVAAARESERVS